MKINHTYETNGGRKSQKQEYALIRKSFPRIYRYPKDGREYFAVDYAIRLQPTITI